MLEAQFPRYDLFFIIQNKCNISSLIKHSDALLYILDWTFLRKICVSISDYLFRVNFQVSVFLNILIF